MESLSGYVYVMINPSLEGMVKIGKTTREPEERAKELSSATGVATPFIVVYKRQFNNCHLAEKLIHTVLSDNGFRVNDQREFFSIDVTTAINLLMKMEDVESDYCEQEAETTSNEGLAESYYRKGDCYYYGFDNTFEDPDMALSCYQKAADLGCTEAYERIGDIWHNEKFNVAKAIQAYKKGAESGAFWCYAWLAFIYGVEPDYQNEHNEKLAWDIFFQKADSSIPYISTPEAFDDTIFLGVYRFYQAVKFMHTDWLEEKMDFFRRYKSILIASMERTIFRTPVDVLRDSYNRYLEFLKNIA